MVAGETPRTKRREMVREPAGSAVSTYDRITASRIWRSRSVSSGDCISPSLLMASNGGQGGGEAVEPQPALGSQRHPVISKHRPPALAPRRDHVRIHIGHGQPVQRAKAKIRIFREHILDGELFRAAERVRARSDCCAPRLVLSLVPPSCAAIERMRGRPDADV